MYVLDTNIISELKKPSKKIDKNVRRWANSVDADDMFISVITMAEIEIGVLSMERKDAKQGTALREWFESYLKVEFKGRVLDVTHIVAAQYARLNVPNKTPVADGLIAATALSHNMAVVTRNESDFKGVVAVNPWNYTG